MHGDLLGRGGLVRELQRDALAARMVEGCSRGWAQEQPGDGGWGEGASQRAEKTFSN